jgi:Ca2+-binding RTX toxin-like protein
MRVAIASNRGFPGANSAGTGAALARVLGQQGVRDRRCHDFDHDNFYDIGQGRGGVLVTVKAGATTLGTDVTEAAGGYAVATPAGGNLSVTFSGGGLPVAVTAHISTATRNAKVDLLDNSEILSSATTTLGAGARDLGLLGVAALSGTGNNLANAITGNSGANLLKGTAGNDVITGGPGRDTMDGGLGADRFDSNSVGESRRGAARDVVTFSHAQHDKIDVSTIDADIDGTAGNQAFAFIGARAFTGVDGQLRFAPGAPGGGVVLQGDTNGDRVSDFEARCQRRRRFGPRRSRPVRECKFTRCAHRAARA